MPVQFGDVFVKRGELILGYADGVVVVLGGRVAAIVRAADEREAKELPIIQRLRSGVSTTAVYKLAHVDPARVPSIGYARRSITGPGLHHGALPTPAGSRIENVSVTGGIRGIVPPRKRCRDSGGAGEADVPKPATDCGGERGSQR